MTSTPRALALASLLLVPAFGACAPGSDPDCAPASRPLSVGESAPVQVVVAAKAGARYVGLLDVNGGFYSTPQRTSRTGAGSLTDLPTGKYRGTVERGGRHLVLLVRGERIPLTETEICD